MREHVRPFRHFTVKTVSDHDAYVVQFRLPGGDLFTIGTLNLSIQAVKRRPVRLKADVVRIARLCDVLAIQEAGAARELLKEAMEHLPKRRLWFGDGRAGQASTPLIYRTDRADGTFVHAYELTGRLHLDPRAAGPTTAKPKWLMVVSMMLAGDQVNVGNIHATPSTRFRLNAIAALIQFRRAGRVLAELADWSFAAGDLNQNALARIGRFLTPWRRRQLRSSQRRLGPLPTHGKRAIDDVYYEIRRK